MPEGSWNSMGPQPALPQLLMQFPFMSKTSIRLFPWSATMILSLPAGAIPQTLMGPHFVLLPSIKRTDWTLKSLMVSLLERLKISTTAKTATRARRPRTIHLFPAEDGGAAGDGAPGAFRIF